jgi:hypothetical protein
MDKLIFVFGSNLAGRHGKGAALFALKNHGAKYGCGVGIQGDSYAIPTKDAKLNTLPISIIKQYVDEFIQFANNNPTLQFNITRVGCGLAGYKDADIAPLFKSIPLNCIIPDGWAEYISG